MEDQKLATSLARRRAWRGDAVLALTFLVLLLQMLLPGASLGAKVVIPLITLAGVALGIGRGPAIMRRQLGD